MSRKSRRAAERRGGCLPALILALAVVALGLVAALVISNMSRPAADEPVVRSVPTAGQYVDVSATDAAEQSLVLNAASYDEAIQQQQSQQPVATPSPTPRATLSSEAGMNDVAPTPTADGYLPIYKKANTDDMMIAITVDECSGVTITKNIAKLAYYYGAHLTLFPTGDNVMRKGMGDVLKICVESLGFEIENRGYSTISKLYNLSDKMMCMEVWKQTIALDYVMNMMYEPHFLRLYGGNGENDLRTHGYLKQLGYYGIASYSHNGSEMTTKELTASLAPGNVYIFKSNRKDAEKINSLMKAAKSAGYRMVTLNELYGYSENARTAAPDNILGEVMPELGDYNNHFYFMKTGDCTWAVYQMQRRLVDLGYLPPGTTDGVFGDSSAQALSKFQAKCGLAATGAADVKTQELLFSADAPKSDVRATIQDYIQQQQSAAQGEGLMP